MAEETDVKKMKVTDLREALAKRGLPSDGLKADLIIRLQARLDEEEFGLVEAPPPSSSGDDINGVVAEEEGKGGGDATISAPASEAPAPQPQAVDEKETAVAAPPQKKVQASLDTISTEENSGEATTTSTEINVVVPKATSEMSFKEKLDQRAKRFGLTENTGKFMGGGTKNDKSKQQQQQQQKQQSGQKREVGTTNKSINENQSEKKQKVVAAQDGGKKRTTIAAAATTTAPTPLLPKDEIERRLARAAKYGTTEGVDELKAQLRMHRFAS